MDRTRYKWTQLDAYFLNFSTAIQESLGVHPHPKLPMPLHIIGVVSIKELKNGSIGSPLDRDFRRDLMAFPPRNFV